MLFRRLGFWTIPPKQCHHPDLALNLALGGVRWGDSDYREPNWICYHPELGFDQTKFMRSEDEYNNDVSTWHQDNSNWNEIVLWCSVASTEIRLPDGNVVAGEDGEVIVFDNQKCHHRIPLAARSEEVQAVRHFIRIPVRKNISLLSESWVSPLNRREGTE